MVFLLIVGIVYAVTTVSFNQNLTVSGIKVYQADGITPIAEGSNQESMWSWDSVNTRFVAAIKVKNVGNTNIDITITSNLASPWDFSPVGILTAITPNENRAITLYATNPSAVGGSSTGDFTVTVSKV